MQAVFNPQWWRDYCEREEVPRIIKRKFDAAKPMGNIASSTFSEIVVVYLVDLAEAISHILPRYQEWLNWAIEHDERLGSSIQFHRMELHRAKALYAWLCDGANDVSSWKLAVEFCRASMEEGTGFPSRQDTAYLDHQMAYMFQAGMYEEAIAEFEKFSKDMNLNFSRVLPLRKLAYALCRHRARGEFDDETVFRAGRMMLRTSLQSKWLNRGHSDLAAMWLKIVYWHRDPSLSPTDTILRAYDNMPKVPRPDFLKSL